MDVIPLGKEEEEEEEEEEEAENVDFLSGSMMLNNPIARRIWLGSGVFMLLLVALNAGEASMTILTTLFCGTCFSWLLLAKVVGLNLLEVWRDLVGFRQRGEKEEKTKESDHRIELAVLGIHCLILIGFMNDNLHVMIMITAFCVTTFASTLITEPWVKPLLAKEVALFSDEDLAEQCDHEEDDSPVYDKNQTKKKRFYEVEWLMLGYIFLMMLLCGGNSVYLDTALFLLCLSSFLPMLSTFWHNWRIDRELRANEVLSDKKDK